jgi:hypothetical protein
MTKEEFFAVGGTDQHLNDPKFDEKEFMTNFISDDEFESLIEVEVSKINEFHEQTIDENLYHSMDYIYRTYDEKMINDINVEKVISSKEINMLKIHRNNSSYSNLDIKRIENRCIEIGRSQGYDLAYELAKLDYEFFEIGDWSLAEPTLRNRLFKIVNVRNVISTEDEIIIDNILNKY